MRTESLPPADHSAWDDFVTRCPGGHLFLTSWWHRSWGCTPEIRVVRGEDGDICGGMALFRTRFLGREAVRRLPFTPYNHPLIDEARLPRVSQQVEVLRCLLDDLLAVGLVDFVHPHHAPLALLPSSLGGFESTVSITYVIDARADDGWKERLADSHRRYLRKAEKQASGGEWRVSKEIDAPDSWLLFRETARRKGFRLGLRRETLSQALREIGRRDAGEIWTLRDGAGTPRSVALLVRDGRFAYYLGGGLTTEDRRGSHGNYLLFHAMIQDTLDRGLSFDFEGSTLPGVERFFRGWGGEIRHNVRQVKISSFATFLLWTAARYARSRKSGWLAPLLRRL